MVEDGVAVDPPATVDLLIGIVEATDVVIGEAGRPTHQKAVTTEEGEAVHREEVVHLSSDAVSIIDEVVLIVALFQVLQSVRAAPLDHPLGASDKRDGAVNPLPIVIMASTQCAASPKTMDNLSTNRKTRLTPRRKKRRVEYVGSKSRATTRTTSPAEISKKKQASRRRTTDLNDNKRTTR